MARGKSKQRILESRALIPTKKQAQAANTLANVPKEVRDVVEQGCAETNKAQKEVAKVEGKFGKFLAKVDDAAKNDTQREVVGGLIGQGWHEGLNVLMRSLGEWSQDTEGDDGFWAKNVDLAQSIPGGVAALVYVVEKALRPDGDPEDKDLPVDKRRPYITPGWRRMVSEGAKIASHLAMSNTIRSLRFRWAESIDEQEEKGQAVKQLTKRIQLLEERNAKLEAQNKKLQPEGPPNPDSGSEQ